MWWSSRSTGDPTGGMTWTRIRSASPAAWSPGAWTWSTVIPRTTLARPRCSGASSSCTAAATASTTTKASPEMSNTGPTSACCISRRCSRTRHAGSPADGTHAGQETAAAPGPGRRRALAGDGAGGGQPPFRLPHRSAARRPAGPASRRIMSRDASPGTWPRRPGRLASNRDAYTLITGQRVGAESIAEPVDAVGRSVIPYGVSGGSLLAHGAPG